MADLTVHDVHLKMITYNMHGFNQGYNTIAELIKVDSPDVMLLQEHWLTPANLSKFDIFTDYFSFGCSALSESVASGILIGRPYGGVITLIKNELRNSTQTIHCADRYVLVKVHNYVLANIYLPCTGTADRLSICQDVVNEIWSWCDKFTNYHLIVAGDFNVNLDKDDIISNIINSFISEHSLIRCDDLFPASKVATYVNDALGHQSNVDYIVTSSPADIVRYEVLDVDINFSDHLPLLTIFACSATTLANNRGQSGIAPSTQLRWDHADKISYYEFTRCQLQAILDHIQVVMELYRNGESLDYCLLIQQIYDDIIDVLNDGANRYVPRHRKNFYKFWWDQEMDLLKEASIESNRNWKAAGKPRYGPIFDKRQSCRLLYRNKIRQNQRLELTCYTNDLHDALLGKDGPAFWNCWRSKFDSLNKCVEVDGCVDPVIIASEFRKHFVDAHNAINESKAAEMKAKFIKLRVGYSGLPMTYENLFDTELVNRIIVGLASGKAAGLDGITSEHLQFCFPSISCILSKLYNLMLLCRYVPPGFGYSYTVPLPKTKDSRSNAVSYDDFRGIAISSVLSKVFEHCIVERFGNFFITDDNQFGFKKNIGCSHAVYTARKVIDYYIKGGSTANLCAIDLSKAFDKINHYGLLTSLLKRNLPVNLLDILELWLNSSWSCVKWFDNFSEFFQINSGVRQGSVLSPMLFAVYLNDFVNCNQRGLHSIIILYADDILLLSPTLYGLQHMLNECERRLQELNMAINFKKTCCLRIGPRFDSHCCCIRSITGCALPWVTYMRYLGVYLLSSRTFRCSLDQAKRGYFRSVNAILGKVGRIASEEVVLQLVSSKCLPILLYGLEVCNIKKCDINSLDFTVNRFLMKLFKTNNMVTLCECVSYFNFKLPSVLLVSRYNKFVSKFNVCENYFCKLVTKLIV